MLGEISSVTYKLNQKKKLEKYYSVNYKIWYRDNGDNGISLALR